MGVDAHHKLLGSSVTRAADVEYSKRLVFDADSAREYLEGELQWTSAYDTNGGGLAFESRFNTSFGVSDEHLVLSDAALDGPERAFRRVE